jgi:hypothetical protein
LPLGATMRAPLSKMKIPTLAMATAFLIPVAIPGAFAQSPSPSPTPPLIDPDFEVVQLHNGINYVDLNNDGVADTVTVAQRENYNAHSFEVTTVYIWAAPSQQEKMQLQIVPFDPTSDEVQKNLLNPLNIIASGGADCTLHDFRLLLSRKDKSLMLITADRKWGQSYSDTQTVIFKVYKLAENTEGLAGWPIYYFKKSREFAARAKYCDVNEAFEKELGLDTDGRPER